MRIEGASAVSGYTMKKPMALEPWLYLAAIGLFVADILAMLLLSGGFRLRRRAAGETGSGHRFLSFQTRAIASNARTFCRPSAIRPSSNAIHAP